MFKKIFLVLFLFFLISPSLVLGAGSTDSKVPALNPLCWQKSKCEAVRKDYFGITDNKNPDSWCVKESPCEGKVDSDKNDYWCKCLPGGQVNTAIKIGGTSTFSNLGVYLLTVYDYALKIVGIVAVLVIIVAGVQWMTSGGNGSIIGAAKKRILGAFVGLFIAYGSFFILNTINPALVNLRLPQTWMLKPQELMPQFCSQLDPTTKFALAAKADNQKTQVTGPMKGEKYQYSYKDSKEKNTLKDFECGRRFVSKDGGSASCFGDYCANFNDYTYACIPDFLNKDNNRKYLCDKGNIYGQIVYNSLIKSCTGQLLSGGEGWEATPVTKVQGVVFVCKDELRYEGDRHGKLALSRTLGDSSSPIKTGNSWYYKLSISNQDIEKGIFHCIDFNGVFGVALEVDFNEACDLLDETHMIGKNGRDLGPDYFFDSEYGLKIKQKYFFTLDDVKNGLRLNIDASKIMDIDDRTEKAFKEAGYFNLFN